MKRRIHDLSFIKHTLRHYHHNLKIGRPVDEVAAIANVHRSTVFRWNNQYGSIAYEVTSDANQIRQNGRVRSTQDKRVKKTNDICKYIENLLKNECQLKSKKITALIEKKFKVFITPGHISKIIRGLGYTYKKVQKTNIYVKTETFKNQRIELMENIGTKGNKNIVCIDETSCWLDDTNNYGRSKKNKPCTVYVKNKDVRKRFSMLCAINNEKPIGCLTVRGAINTVTFTKFIVETVIPALKPNQKILLDNASIHKSRYFWRTMDSQNINRGIFIYNVPYSPKYNPIEYVFNTIKRELKNTVKTVEEFHAYVNDFIGKAIDFNKYYEHCFNHLFDDPEY